MNKADLTQQNLILVSNREPYIHNTNHHNITVTQAVGGLVTALDPLMQKSGGTWIAWGSGSADFTVCDKENKISVPPKKERYILK